MAFLLLSGSLVLPLGDFSLLQDIPGMYGNYCKVTTPEELGVADFIGDYLLQGKDIFGHNKHDKQAGKEVQFQHQADPLTIVLFLRNGMLLSPLREPKNKYSVVNYQVCCSNHAKALFRPPIAFSYHFS